MQIECPNCQKYLKVSGREKGLPVPCPHCSEYILVPKNRFAPSVIIDDFIIKEFLGKGMVGNVFRVHQISLDRPAALKILHDENSEDKEYISELIQEAQIAAKLNHPNIVQCYAVGKWQNTYYYAMEYVEGKSLKQVLQKKWKVSAEETIRYLRQVALALQYAWQESRLVHRDVKPDNIMITVDGITKLADLGLACPAQEVDNANDDFIRGTPQYIAPESVLGLPIDFRGDIYSLGCAMYHCVTGHYPFEADAPVTMVQEHVKSTVKDPCEYTPDLPQGLCKVMNKMLMKKPQDRYQDYSLLIKDLDKIETEAFAKRTGNIPLLDSETEKNQKESYQKANKPGSVVKDISQSDEDDLITYSSASKYRLVIAIGIATIAGIIVFAAISFNNNLKSNDLPTKNSSLGKNKKFPDQEQAISAEMAKDFIGKHKTIKGKIVRITFKDNLNGNPTYIDIDKPFPYTSFNAVIWERDLNFFTPAFKEKLINQDVYISGKIKKYKGKPQITITSKDQIRICKKNNPQK